MSKQEASALWRETAKKLVEHADAIETLNEDPRVIMAPLHEVINLCQGTSTETYKIMRSVRDVEKQRGQ